LYDEVCELRHAQITATPEAQRRQKLSKIMKTRNTSHSKLHREARIFNYSMIALFFFVLVMAFKL